jgi:uncharacterized protein YjbJ (UPF0337 family)
MRTIASGEAGDACATVGSVLTADPGAAPSSTTKKEWCTMGAKSDQAKGRAKEAVGSLTGDKDLKSAGKADRRAGEAKEKVGHAKDKVEEVVDKTKDKAEEAIDKTKNALHRKK